MFNFFARQLVTKTGRWGMLAIPVSLGLGALGIIEKETAAAISTIVISNMFQHDKEAKRRWAEKQDDQP